MAWTLRNMEDKKPRRIGKILQLIRKIWLKNSDLRLCQLIGNCYDHLQDLYHVEDDELEERLRKTYNV